MFSRASVQAGAAPHILKNVRDLNVACYQASPVSSVPSWPILARCTGRPDSEPRVAQKTAADPLLPLAFLRSGRYGSYIGRVGGRVVGDVQQRLTTAGRASIPCDHHLVLVFDTAKLKVRYPVLCHSARTIESNRLLIFGIND
jgi:hypothetical protein